MNITKQYIIDNLIRSDGKLNNRKITEDMDIENIYIIFHNIDIPTCEHGHNKVFISFNKGYSTSCVNKKCTKDRAYKNRKQDYTAIHEKVKETKKKKKIWR